MARMEDLLAGAVGGFAGGMAMRGMMLLSQGGAVRDALAPIAVDHRIVERTVVTDGARPPATSGLASGIYLALTAGLGAAYGFARPLILTPLPTLVAGAVYGLAVYGATAASAAPVFAPVDGTLDRPLIKQQAGVGRQLVGHLVYGIVTAFVNDEVRQLLSERLQPVEIDRHEWRVQHHPYPFTHELRGASAPTPHGEG